MHSRILRPIRDEAGAVSTEYALTAAIIVFAIAAGVGLLGSALQGLLSMVAAAL